MADCNSLESLMTSLTNEVAALKTKVATLESKQNNFATKSELSTVETALRSAIEAVRTALEGSLNALRSFIEDVLRRLLGLDSGDLKQRVSNLEIRVGGIEGITDSIRRAVEGVQNRLNKLEGAFFAFKGYVDAKLSEAFGKIQALENTMGQILMDVKNIYNILSKLQRSVDDLWGQIRLLWAAIAGAAAALATAVATITTALAGLGARLGALEALKKLLEQLLKQSPKDGKAGANGKDGKAGANGKDGKDGKDAKEKKDGKDAKDGKDGKDAKDGKAGANGKDGKAGANGKDGKDGKDAKEKKDVKMEFSTISVRIFDKCKTDGSGATFRNESVQCIKGLENQTRKEFYEISEIAARECKKEIPVATFPDWWPTRIGADRPQAIVYYREWDGVKYGAYTHRVSIPHYSKPKGFKPSLPSINKGKYQGTLTLRDNSKIIVCCSSKGESQRVLNSLRSLIGDYARGSKSKYGEYGDEELRKVKTKPIRLDFYSTGQKNSSPDWSVELT